MPSAPSITTATLFHQLLAEGVLRQLSGEDMTLYYAAIHAFCVKKSDPKGMDATGTTIFRQNTQLSLDYIVSGILPKRTNGLVNGLFRVPIAQIIEDNPRKLQRALKSAYPSAEVLKIVQSKNITADFTKQPVPSLPQPIVPSAPKTATKSKKPK